ncbi:MAG TPA: hypothetical protein VFP72_16065 [Kineosporiaceae bacterium]|nr:hypothetical protein [Kineosporiaceae bacterium]
MQHAPARASRLRAGSVFGAVAVATTAALVTRSSLAAFTATTQNSGNHWGTATVVLSDDSQGVARFNVSGLVPGGPGSSDAQCIRVSYAGSATSDIRLFATVSNDTGLGQYLTLKIEEGTGGMFADCTGFTPSSTLYTPGTLAGFCAAHGTWANGVSTWRATGAANRTYRITYTLVDDSAAQGTSVNAVFSWQAQSVPHA